MPSPLALQRRLAQWASARKVVDTPLSALAEGSCRKNLLRRCGPIMAPGRPLCGTATSLVEQKAYNSRFAFPAASGLGSAKASVRRKHVFGFHRIYKNNTKTIGLIKIYNSS